MKMFRFLVLAVALTAFAFSGVAVAGDMFYVVKDNMGAMKVVEKKPQDAGMIVKGPFKSKDAAQDALQKAKKEMKKG